MSSNNIQITEVNESSQLNPAPLPIYHHVRKGYLRGEQTCYAITYGFYATALTLEILDIVRISNAPFNYIAMACNIMAGLVLGGAVLCKKKAYDFKPKTPIKSIIADISSGVFIVVAVVGEIIDAALSSNRTVSICASVVSLAADGISTICTVASNIFDCCFR